MFRFTIRELVLLTLVVALGVGWWGDHRQLDSARTNAQQRAQMLERREAQWQRVNSWLTQSLENGGGFGTSAPESNVGRRMGR
jgi:hypothetical protein